MWAIMGNLGSYVSCPFDLKGSFLCLVSNNIKKKVHSECCLFIFQNGLIFSHLAGVCLYLMSPCVCFSKLRLKSKITDFQVNSEKYTFESIKGLVLSYFRRCGQLLTDRTFNGRRRLFC